MTCHWSPDTIIIRRGPGRPMVVRVVRPNIRRRRRIAMRMRAAGRPSCWIARALKITRERLSTWWEIAP